MFSLIGRTIRVQSRREITFQKLLSSQIRSLFIQTQETPNENALKFIPSGAVLLPSPKAPTVEVDGIKDALEKSELAFKLLSLNNRCISSVLLGYNFLTVVKKTDGEMKDNKKVPDWSVLKPQIFSIMTEHLTMGRPVLTDKYYDYIAGKMADQNHAEELEEEDEEIDPNDEVVELVKEMLVTRIQPAIQEDGGDIKFLKWDGETGTVYLRLIGACKSCSSSEITLKNGIEEMLKYYIDEVKSVEQVDEEALSEDSDPSQGFAEQPKNFKNAKLDDVPPSL
ncbi:hypothetical protein HII13_002621 [Brettanomyces bruxellensis]|nr:hypothetical protein HII13_002621 [Brettanomyces bruxellensis]